MQPYRHTDRHKDSDGRPPDATCCVCFLFQELSTAACLYSFRSSDFLQVLRHSVPQCVHNMYRKSKLEEETSLQIVDLTAESSSILSYHNIYLAREVQGGPTFFHTVVQMLYSVLMYFKYTQKNAGLFS